MLRPGLVVFDNTGQVACHRQRIMWCAEQAGELGLRIYQNDCRTVIDIVISAGSTLVTDIVGDAKRSSQRVNFSSAAVAPIKLALK